MSHRQHPIGSGFDAAATADDVLAGVDLSGTNVIVTGGHNGVGLETTRALVKAGASVTVGARNIERARSKLGDVHGVEVGRLDLVDPASVDAFVVRWLESGRELHILINNAGVTASAELVVDDRGYEEQFATNHLGHFQLTLGLLPALRAAGGARVVTVSSGAQRFGEICWDDPHFAGRGYDANVAYAQSKLANVLFAVELDRRASGDGVRAYAVHPGVVVGTNLNSSVGEDALRQMGLVDDAGDPIIDPESGRRRRSRVRAPRSSRRRARCSPTPAACISSTTTSRLWTTTRGPCPPKGRRPRPCRIRSTRSRPGGCGS